MGVWEIPIEPDGEVNVPEIPNVVVPATIKVRVEGGYARYRFESFDPDPKEEHDNDAPRATRR